jgi:hypothetical protein
MLSHLGSFDLSLFAPRDRRLTIGSQSRARVYGE